MRASVGIALMGGGSYPTQWKAHPVGRDTRWPRWGIQVLTDDARDRLEVDAYREATGREPRNLGPFDVGYEQWTYGYVRRSRPVKLTDRTQRVLALTTDAPEAAAA
jgi:hypothetical protein